jgi:two-component system chemotaxis response regulator CheY
MKTLIVEDDFTSRLVLQELLRPYGQAHIAVNGTEAVLAVSTALKANEPYDLVCLDIMMPEMDGHEALTAIRALERRAGRVCRRGAGLVMSQGLLKHTCSHDPECKLHCTRGSRILMVTSLHDGHTVRQSYQDTCDGFLGKPADKAKLLGCLRELELIDVELASA